MVTRKAGKGRITYIGAWLDDKAPARVMAWAADQAGAAPILAGLPDRVEASQRGRGARRVTVLIN